ncbi:Na+/H+ antiporter subunit E [Clostridium sp. MB40-C1]|uniref:Na+/H+ antiporter subunit E n=1 Tax=Clostridium sp. MB40-C1 TaxID=3070996 RepID=UPI0027E0994A|nr:Na+/H+ antiporter subunit E [Clostridium sp. MB40-C1]WMJ80184.1 Na+/H+ antiporter subunit E [Clostridium sp. MB40-C1]
MTFGVMILYLIFWIVLCEKFNIETFILGITVCILLSILNENLFGKTTRKEKSLLKNTRYWAEYIFLLVKEVVIANINVAIIVLSPSMNISPGIVEFKTKLKSNFCRMVLANSITLTPGTITVDIEDDILRIHCLKREYIEGVMDSKFEKILLKIEE